MERLKLRFTDLNKALKTLKDILEEKYSIIVRDATIQRFEYTFEAFWKYVREYLKEKEGIYCNSPKRCFRELFSIGVFNTEETITQLLEMVDARNMTSHTYKEEIAQLLYNKVETYYKLMEEIVLKLKII